MAEKPIMTHDFVPPVVKIRDEDPSKFMGPSNVIIRSFKHEKDRIKVFTIIFSWLRVYYRKILRIIRTQGWNILALPSSSVKEK